MAAYLSGEFDFQAFSDNGTPLVGGRLYTYAYGTTTRKIAYTDAAGTVPHTYTSDGVGGQYIALNARGELPAPLYLTAGSYDIALKRADGSTVWTKRADPVGDAAGLQADLASTTTGKGAALVGFIQSGTGAVARTALDKERESISVEDFRATGAADDTAAFQAAFARAAVLGRATIRATSGASYTISGKISVTSSNVTFDGQGCRINNTISNGDPLFDVSTSGVVFPLFKDFSVQGNSGNGHGISAIGAGGVIQVLNVNNVRFDGLTSAIAKNFAGSAMPAYAIYAYGIYTLRVTDGYAQNGSGGIYCDSAQKIKVTGWNGDNLTDYGIFVSNCLAVDISGQNTLTGCGGVAKAPIYVDGCESVSIDRNRIKGGGGTYAILTGDTLTRRLTISNNGFEIYTPSCIKITTAVESFSVRDNLLKFIGSVGPFTDGILLTDRTGGGFLSFSGEITGNDIQIGGSDTLTNGVNINVTINSARALRIGNNTIGGGGVASVVTNGINLQGNGLGNSVHNNSFAMAGGSVTNGIVVGAAHTSTKVEDNFANGTVTNFLVDSGVRTRVYESGSGNLTLTGCTTSPSAAYTYERTGRTVTMKIITSNGTSNATTATLTGLPASIQPASNQWLYVPLFDNGAEVQGFAQVGATSTVTLSNNIVGGAFTAAGTKGIRSCAITWQL